MQAITDKDFGINLTVHIACSDEQELYQHLSILRQKIKKAFEKDPEFPRADFKYSNCSGTYDAVVVQDM